MAANPSGPGQYAPKVYPAWTDVMRQVNRKLPTALRRIDKSILRAQGALHHHRAHQR